MRAYCNPYGVFPRKPTPESIAREQRVMDWWRECSAWYKRGLVTKEEMFTIFERGPQNEAPAGTGDNTQPAYNGDI